MLATKRPIKMRIPTFYSGSASGRDFINGELVQSPTIGRVQAFTCRQNQAPLQSDAFETLGRTLN